MQSIEYLEKELINLLQLNNDVGLHYRNFGLKVLKLLKSKSYNIQEFKEIELICRKYIHSKSSFWNKFNELKPKDFEIDEWDFISYNNSKAIY